MSLYVGKAKGGKRSVFSSERRPTQGTHGHRFTFVEGPFRTKGGAEHFAHVWNAGDQVTQSQAEHFAAEVRAGRQPSRSNRVSGSAKEEWAYDRRDTPIVVAMVGDGSLYGASANRNAYEPRYWLSLRAEHEPYALFEARVPHKLADKLEVHGTTDQWFSDGYEGWRAVAPYLKKKPFYISNEYDPRGPYVWDPQKVEED